MAIALSAAALGLSACGTLGPGYYWQAARGQLALFNRAKPIGDVVGDERTPPRIRRLLGEIPAIKAYGERNGLKPTRNYSEYVQLDRPAAVWVVSASEPLRFEPRRWEFPVVGSFTYVGWFDREAALSYSDEVKREPQGWDVSVRGARAYSTLGWFRDAVLSSMIPDGPEALGDVVNVVLHESVHATLYIADQSSFNESVASFVADRLTADYLSATRGASSEELKGYQDDVKRSAEYTRKMHDAYGELDRLYHSALSTGEKLSEKRRILERLRAELRAPREINNATLIQFKTYETGEKDFEKVFQACKGDWRRFFGALGTLKPADFGKNQAEEFSGTLERLAGRGC